MNLILLNENDAIGPDRYRLTEHRADHIRNILRAQLGDRLQVGLINGGIGSAEVIELSDQEITLETIIDQPLPLPPVEIDLVCALPRPQTVKKILRLCGMMAIRRLFFVRANRVEKSFFDSPLLTDDKMRPLLLEGLAQGKFTRLTEIEIARQFRPFLEDRLPDIYPDSNRPVRILPEQSTDQDAYQVLSKETVFPEAVLIAIGPEGGWVDFELDLFAKADFLQFSLGPWTLRVEDAVSATLAQIELCRRTWSAR